ncbi:MAG: phage tail protein [Opitutales bacterium]|nr:phage tail protein [Opitutales bacterium]
MADPFLGQVRQLGFSFAPQGYAKCDGATLTIAQNTALYSLLSIKFGGNGTTNFCLPDLRGRVPMFSANYVQGTELGVESVTLTQNTMPRHTHSLMSMPSSGDFPLPRTLTEPIQKKVFAQSVLASDQSAQAVYGVPQNLISLHPNTSTYVGGDQSHNNLQPSLVINFVIALQGSYPQRS